LAADAVLKALKHVWLSLQPSALDLDLYVLACEDLILHKLLAGRLLDRVDAAMLLRANRTELDLEYLLAWTTTLSLRAELAQVWEEAFPGEAMPERGGSTGFTGVSAGPKHPPS
jgi:hypothetical protein